MCLENNVETCITEKGCLTERTVNHCGPLTMSFFLVMMLIRERLQNS